MFFFFYFQLLMTCKNCLGPTNFGECIEEKTGTLVSKRERFSKTNDSSVTVRKLSQEFLNCLFKTRDYSL